jgi:hypothetical protein
MGVIYLDLNLDEIKDALSNSLSNIKDGLSQLQQNFLESKLYNIVDGALDIGIRLAMPDCIEDSVISIKDSILQNGLIEGIKETVKSTFEFGKSCLNIATDNFETIDQLETAVKTNGTLDILSSFFDKGLNSALSAGLITKTIKSNIKSTKNSFIKKIDTNLTAELKDQKQYLKKIEQFATKWQKYFEAENLEKMQEVYEDMKEYINDSDICPFESTLEKYNEIEMLQNLLENNGGNFDLSEDELELVEALAN